MLCSQNTVSLAPGKMTTNKAKQRLFKLVPKVVLVVVQQTICLFKSICELIRLPGKEVLRRWELTV